MAMDLILTRLRNTTLRAFVAWTVAFGLVFQILLPVVAAQAKARDPLAGAGVICALHLDNESSTTPDDHSSPPGGKDLDSHCTLCALLHAAKLAVPAAAAPSIVLAPTTVSRLDRVADHTPRAIAPHNPHSPRGPPPTI